VDVPDGVVEPQRLPGIDTAPKQRLFIRDLIAPGRTFLSYFLGAADRLYQ
jgi:hypothetical protein